VPVSEAVRRAVLERAGGRCEYCRIDCWPLTVDHVVPVIAWKSDRSGQSPPAFDADDLENLAAACFPCNRAKSNTTSGLDELTATHQPLFHPRQHVWDEHFAWVEDYRAIVGVTPIGRGTVARLRLNREVYRRQRSRLRAAMQGGGPPWP